MNPDHPPLVGDERVLVTASLGVAERSERAVHPWQGRVFEVVLRQLDEVAGVGSAFVTSFLDFA